MLLIIELFIGEPSMTIKGRSVTDVSELEKKLPATIVFVKSQSDMPSAPRSDVQYWIDYAGLLEVNEITVPSDGLFIRGTHPDLTGIGSTEDDFTLFSSETAGNVFLKDIYVTVSGTGSKILDTTDPTNNSAVEFNGVNFYDCSSIGNVTDYRQFSMTNVFLVGGKPEVTFSGSMNGIYIDTALGLNFDSDWSGSLFNEGTDLTLSSRFFSNMRIDLPTNASFCNFRTANFLDSSLCQMERGQYSRNGVVNSGDNNFFPNLDPSDLVSEWRNNNGLRNTHEGGKLEVVAESATQISSAGVYYDINGTWTSSDLQHFSVPANGQLKNDGKNPQEFFVQGNMVIDGGANDVLSVKVVKWNNTSSSFEDVSVSNQQVLSIIGGRDVAIISLFETVNLELNDYIKLQVANLTDTTNVTLEIGSKLRILNR